MKTREQFEEAKYRALLLASGYLKDCGFDVENFYNMDNEFAVVATVLDDNGEEIEYVATFEEVI